LNGEIVNLRPLEHTTVEEIANLDIGISTLVSHSEYRAARLSNCTIFPPISNSSDVKSAILHVGLAKLVVKSAPTGSAAKTKMIGTCCVCFASSSVRGFETTSKVHQLLHPFSNVVYGRDLLDDAAFILHCRAGHPPGAPPSSFRGMVTGEGLRQIARRVPRLLCRKLTDHFINERCRTARMSVRRIQSESKTGMKLNFNGNFQLRMSPEMGMTDNFSGAT